MKRDLVCPDCGRIIDPYEDCPCWDRPLPPPAPRHAAPDPLRDMQQVVWARMLTEAANLATLYRALCLPVGIDPPPPMVLQAFTLLEAFGDLRAVAPPPLEVTP